MASRAIWEAEAIARQAGWRGGLAGELERRARDRRVAKLEAGFEAERRASDRRAR